MVVPAYSFFASAETVRGRARPVFPDIDARAYCMRVEDVEARLGSAARAVMPLVLGSKDTPTKMNA